jgi:hypothetical protein
MIAAESSHVAFVVLLAGPALPGDETLLLQAAALLRAQGAREAAVQAAVSANREAYAIVRREPDPVRALELLREHWRRVGARDSQQEASLRRTLSPWYRFFLSYDPGGALGQVTCPVLAVNGSKDVQVTPREHLGALRDALDRAGNRSYTIREMEGLNHLFQTAVTGFPDEYGIIEETLAPVVIRTITEWILAL